MLFPCPFKYENFQNNKQNAQPAVSYFMMSDYLLCISPKLVHWDGVLCVFISILLIYCNLPWDNWQAVKGSKSHIRPALTWYV